MAKSRKLLEHLLDLKYAGVSLDCVRVSKGAATSTSGTIRAGYVDPNTIIVAPEKDKKGTQLICWYHEAMAQHPLMGPRVVEFSHPSQRLDTLTEITLSNNMRYRVLRRPYSSRLYFIRGSEKGALVQGKVFDYRRIGERE